MTFFCKDSKLKNSIFIQVNELGRAKSILHFRRKSSVKMYSNMIFHRRIKALF